MRMASRSHPLFLHFVVRALWLRRAIDQASTILWVPADASDGAAGR
jgi:hypothetical protein